MKAVEPVPEYTRFLLKDYPFDTVRFACVRCDRQGSRSKHALVTEHGADAAMLDLRESFGGCELRRGKPCGAYYPDLVEG
jgi:hypothetical protein